ELNVDIGGLVGRVHDLADKEAFARPDRFEKGPGGRARFPKNASHVLSRKGREGDLSRILLGRVEGAIDGEPELVHPILVARLQHRNDVAGRCDNVAEGEVAPFAWLDPLAPDIGAAGEAEDRGLRQTLLPIGLVDVRSARPARGGSVAQYR